MIYLVTGRKDAYDKKELAVEGIVFGKAKNFVKWVNSYDGLMQFDTETNIVEGLYGWKGHLEGKNKRFVLDLDEDGNKIPCKRECYVAQFGDETGDDQWIFDVPSLSKKQLERMKVGLTYRRSNDQKSYLIHNFLFDYGVVKNNFGIDMNSVIDTFICSKAVTTGLKIGEDLPKGYNSLAGCASRYLGIDLSKATQTTFTGEPMSVEQIKYAAIDVTVLGPMFPALYKEVEEWGLENAVTLESALARSYGDAMFENLYLDADEWRVNMEHQFKEVARIEEEFHDLMFGYFEEECHELGFIQKDDEYQFIKQKVWTGRARKKDIMFYLYPDMPKNFTTQKEYQDYYDMIADMDNGPEPKYLNWILTKNFEPLELYLIKHHNDWLTEQGIFIPKDEVLINLKSPDQKLQLFRLIDPDLENTDKETIAKIKHPLAEKLTEYNKASKLSTSYGQNFLDAINPDGMFRIQSFTQILNTGRSSMSMMQLLPLSKGRVVEILHDNLSNCWKLLTSVRGRQSAAKPERERSTTSAYARTLQVTL